MSFEPERIFAFYDEDWTHVDYADEVILRHTLRNESFVNGKFTATVVSPKFVGNIGFEIEQYQLNIMNPVFYFISEKAQAEALQILVNKFCRKL